jgi:hypothetical protein
MAFFDPAGTSHDRSIKAGLRLRMAWFRLQDLEQLRVLDTPYLTISAARSGTLFRAGFKKLPGRRKRPGLAEGPQEVFLREDRHGLAADAAAT